MWLDVARILDQKGWSQRQLAAELEKKSNDISRFFRPGFDPKLSLIIRIAEILEVDVRELFNPELDSKKKTMPRSQSAVEALQKMKKKVVKKSKKK